MATPYRTDFGSANAGGAPTWDYFVRTDTSADVTPHPVFTEAPAGSGAFNWSIDWTIMPAGVVSIAWRATCGGVSQWGVEVAPSVTTVGGLQATGTVPLPYTSDALIASAKRNGAIPTAQATFQTSDFL